MDVVHVAIIVGIVGAIAAVVAAIVAAVVVGLVLLARRGVPAATRSPRPPRDGPPRP